MPPDPSTVLPHLAYGLRGFDVDVQELERHLSGSSDAVGRQLVAYLDREQAVMAAKDRARTERHQAPVYKDCGARLSRRDAMQRHQRSVHGNGA